MRTRVYSFVILLPLVLHAAGFWRVVILNASNPYQLDYGEGIVLYQASQIANPEIAYKPINSYPFVVFHYPPLYHWCVLAVSFVTGDLLVAGRAVSVISGALTAVLLGLLVFVSLPDRDAWRRWTAALFAGLLPSLLGVMLWTSLARVDMLALLLSFAGLAVFVLARRRTSLHYLALMLLVAAVFTKQTSVAAAIACLATAFIVDARHARRLTVFAFILGALGLTGLTWWTRGGVLRHLFLYNQNTFSLDRMVQGVVQNAVLILPILVLAGFFVASLWNDLSRITPARRWRRLRAWLVHSPLRRLGIVASFMLPMALLVALTYGKTGSNFNYFIEWNLVCCVLAALALYRYWNVRWSIPVVLFAAYVVPVVFVLQGLPSSVLAFGPSSSASRVHGTTQRQAHATLLELVRRAPGPVLSENMLVLVQSGKDVPAEPAILRELAMSGTWDERLLTRLIEERKFALIISVDLSSRIHYTAAVAAAVDRSYELTRQVAQYEVYEPRAGN